MSQKIFAVVNPTTGNLFTPNAAGTHFSVRVQSTTMESTNGYMNARRRSAFLRVEKELLNEFAKACGLNPNFPQTAADPDNEGKFVATQIPFKLDGQIQVRESYSPFYEGQDPKSNPTTGEVFLKEGNEVYRDTQFITDTSAPAYVFDSGDVVEEGAKTLTPSVNTNELPA